MLRKSQADALHLLEDEFTSWREGARVTGRKVKPPPSSPGRPRAAFVDDDQTREDEYDVEERRAKGEAEEPVLRKPGGGAPARKPATKDKKKPAHKRKKASDGLLLPGGPMEDPFSYTRKSSV